jgi:lysozyme
MGTHELPDGVLMVCPSNRSLLALLLINALTLAACGPLEEGSEVVTRGQALERVCGADRYTGPQGVDVSTYQQNFDWTAREQEGIQFGIARVSNGTEIIDDYFDRNWREMKAHGILRGAYQYFRPGQDAGAQANLMVDKLGRLGPGDLPAVIDVETADGQSPSVVSQKVRTWLEIVEEGTGKRPMIYTSGYFWRDEVGDTGLGDYPLWIANYDVECPLTPEGWDEWTMWQYCDGNPDYCSNGEGFDRDVFNGTAAELEAFAAGGGTYGATVVETSFDDPVTVVTDEIATVWIEVENTGSVAWDSETLLGTTEPRDRDSAFATGSWVAPNRVAGVDGTVEPGASYRFEFDLQAPSEPGTYEEHFGLVQEGVAWFGDPGQEGPADDGIVVELEVTSPEADDPGADDELQPEDDEGTSTDASDEDATPPKRVGKLPPLVGPSPGVKNGCSQTSAEPSWFWALAFLGLALGRRVRR